MKLERIPEYITSTCVILCGIGFAMYAGKATGEGQVSRIVMIVAALVAILILVRLRAKVWMLIPLCAPLGGNLGGGSVPVGVNKLAVLYVFGGYLALIALLKA
jgi:hypothetical protein